MRRNSKQERERERAGDAKMFRAWKKYHRDERDAVLAGPHGAALAEVFRMLDHLEHVRPEQLVGFIRSINWAAIDCDTRLVVLHEVNTAITKYRERRGADALSDPLPGEPDTPFRMIHKILHQVPATRGEASPELIRQISEDVT
jgi:hypothetical protein